MFIRHLSMANELSDGHFSNTAELSKHFGSGIRYPTCGIRTRDPCDTLLKYVATSYPIQLTTHCLKAVHIPVMLIILPAVQISIHVVVHFCD